MTKPTTRRLSRIEAATARVLATQAPLVRTAETREANTREVARNRARYYGGANLAAVRIVCDADCARETWLVADVYLAAFVEALKARGVAVS